MKIEDRIRHFLRLAEDAGASASEREVAAAQAEKLMVRYRIESLPDVDSPREDVQVIKVWVEGGRGSMGPMHVIGLSNLAKTLSCAAIVQDGRRGSEVTIAGAAGDLALLSELFNSTLVQCKVGLKEALRGRVFYPQSDRLRFRRGYTLGFFNGVVARVRAAVRDEALGTSKELVVAGRASRAEHRIYELYPEQRVSRSRMTLYRDDMSRGEADGYQSGVGDPARQRVGGDRVAIGR